MSTDVSADPSAAAATPGTIDLKVEVITVPVSDIDRAKAFYEGLGFRLDADIARGDAFRVVQMTPLHSGCSISLGKGLGAVFGTGDMEPGTQKRIELIVSDIVAAREDLISRGADVGEFFHIGETGVAAGLHPTRESYGSYASFADPDGNTWLLQEVNERLPGRTWDD
jgi:catechol 2,3-dioxygenase-like lactoylglutathione lyase family enzyme